MSVSFSNFHDRSPGTLDYRAFRLTPGGDIQGVEHVLAIDDDHARSLAAMIANTHGVDLWERSRFLGTFPPLGFNAPGAKA